MTERAASPDQLLDGKDFQGVTMDCNTQLSRLSFPMAPNWAKMTTEDNNEEVLTNVYTCITDGSVITSDVQNTVFFKYILYNVDKRFS